MLNKILANSTEILTLTKKDTENKEKTIKKLSYSIRKNFEEKSRKYFYNYPKYSVVWILVGEKENEKIGIQAGRNKDIGNMFRADIRPDAKAIIGLKNDRFGK